jgi:hypothetical protein
MRVQALALRRDTQAQSDLPPLLTHLAGAASAASGAGGGVGVVCGAGLEEHGEVHVVLACGKGSDAMLRLCCTGLPVGHQRVTVSGHARTHARTYLVPKPETRSPKPYIAYPEP